MNADTPRISGAVLRTALRPGPIATFPVSLVGFQVKRVFFSSLVLIAALVGSSAGRGAEAVAQSASGIISRYKKASGDNAAARIRNTSMSGSIRAGDGSTGVFSYRIASPDRIRIDTESPGRKFSECYNGKSAWIQDSRRLRTLLGSEAKSLRLVAVLANTRLRDLSRYTVAARAGGKAIVDGREANVVAFTLGEARVKLFLDASSNLVAKEERETNEGLEEIFYSDYRKVDGVMEPFSIRIKTPQGESVVALDRVEHNQAFEQAVFRYPVVEGARPVPDVESLLKAVVANQEKIEELLEHYTYRATETEREENNGRIKEVKTHVYEVTPVGGRHVSRLMSVDGKELSPSEREKEDKRVQKAVEDAVKRAEKKHQKEQQHAEETDSAKEERVTILSILRIEEVTSVRRETFRNQEVVAFDFEPRKDFKPRNLAESIVSKLAGTIWVDENVKQIVRLEARLTDTFKIGGGLLASIAPSSAFVFDQEKVNDEVWLPSYAEANLSARVALFKKFKQNSVTRFSDYKKYQIDSEYKLNSPKTEEKPEH
jgi:outer membrane lipoprotein-sorting protein